jgi:hypothetical protein
VPFTARLNVGFEDIIIFKWSDRAYGDDQVNDLQNMKSPENQMQKIGAELANTQMWNERKTADENFATKENRNGLDKHPEKWCHCISRVTF